jgi:hypothetical protein
MLLHEILPQVMARKESIHVAQQVQMDTRAGDMEVFSVAYVSGATARQVLHGVSCDAGKTCLTSKVLLSATVFIYTVIHKSVKHFKNSQQTMHRIMVILTPIPEGSTSFQQYQEMV